MKTYICIDIGGTSMKYGLIQEDGIFLTTGSIPSEAMKYGGPGIMKKTEHIIEEFLKDYQPEGICISTAGMVDWKEGKILYAAPLIPDYTGTEIKKIIEERFHLPCEVENDVNCAGLAEDFSGAAKGSRISVCLTVGTGIGGAVIIDHQVFHGFSGSACEVGYMHLPGGDFQDLGASSILVKKVAAYKGISSEKIDGKYVFEQAKQGDRDCIKAIEEMCDILGMGIANICYVINPEVVVLGGGIMAQKEYLREPLEKSIRRYLLPTVAKHTRWEFACHENHAGMIGAFCHFKRKKEIKYN